MKKLRPEQRQVKTLCSAGLFVPTTLLS